MIDWPAWVLVAVASLADILGGYLVVRERRLGARTLLTLLGVSGGFMLSAALLGRLPEAVARTPNAAQFVIAGYLAIFVFESFFSTHAHGADTLMGEHSHTLVGTDLIPAAGDHETISRPASLAALVGLLLHTFFDGVAIAGGFALSRSVGVLMFIAVVLHKIPEGLSLSTIMLAAGRSQASAFLASVAIALSTLLGGALTFAAGSINRAFAHDALALATGTLIYIAATDLIPATNPSRSKLAIGFVLLGVVAYAASVSLLQAVGLE